MVSLLSLWIGFAAHPKFYVYLLPSVPRCAIINAKQTGLLAFPYSPHIPIALGRLHTRPLYTSNIPNLYAVQVQCARVRANLLMFQARGSYVANTRHVNSKVCGLWVVKTNTLFT